MMRHLLGYLSLCMAISMLASGCGGGDKGATNSAGTSSATASSSTKDTAFLAKADALCKPAMEYYRTTDFPYQNFDPRNPKARELHGVGTYLRDSPVVSSLTKVEDLTPPADLTSKWNAFTGLTHPYLSDYRAQYQAALKGDAATFTALGGQVTGQVPGLRDAAKKVGFAAKPTGCLYLFL
jgi:hypothetical protein